MRTFLFLTLVSSLCACAMSDSGRRITVQDTAWIEKGRTTRQQVVEKFGEPSMIGTYKGVGEYVEYLIPPPVRLPLQPTQSGPLPQEQRPPIDRTIPRAESPDDRFWVMYNAKGIVHDFGFGSPPSQ